MPSRLYLEIEQRSISDLTLQRDRGSLDVVTSEQSSLPRSCAHSIGKTKHWIQNQNRCDSLLNHLSVIFRGFEAL